MNFLPPPSSARSQQQRRRNTITTPPLHSQQPQFQPQPHPQPPCVAVSPVPTPVAGHTYVSQGSLLPQPVYQQQQQQQQHQTQPAQHQQHQQVQSTQQHNVNTSGHVDWSDMQFLSELKAEINSTPTNTPFGEFVQAPSLPSSESFFTSALPPQQQQQQQQSQNTLTMSSGRTAQPRKMSVPADTSRIQASKTFGCLGDAVEADNNASDSDSDFSNPFDDVPFDDNNDSKEMGALASHNNLMATRSPGNVVSSSAPVLPTNPDALTLTTKKPPAAACVPHLKIQTPRQQSPQHYHQPQQQQQWQGQNETQEHSNDLFFQQEFLSARLETHSKEPSNSFVQSARSTSTSSKNAFNGNNPAPFSYTASAPIGSASAISRSSSVSSISPIQSVSAAVTSARTSKSSKVPKEPKSSPQMVVMDLIDINGTGNVGGSSGSCGKKVMSLNCPTCGFTFFDEKSLSEHMRIHAMAAAATPSSPTTDLLDFLTSPALSPATNSVSAPSSLRKHSSASKTIKAEKGSSSAHFGLFKKHKTISSSSKSKALAESSVGLNDSIASQPMQLIKPVRRLTELESIIIVQSLARRWLVKQRTKNECKKKRKEKILFVCLFVSNLICLVKRLRIVKELYETETTYINLLQELFTLYANPLKKFIDDGKPLISIKDVEFIFSQFQEILLFNSTFNVDLKIKKESWNIDSTIADTFLKLDFDRMYKIYSNYTLSYTDILARVLKLSKENPNFEAFIAVNKKITVERLCYH